MVHSLIQYTGAVYRQVIYGLDKLPTVKKMTATGNFTTRRRENGRTVLYDPLKNSSAYHRRPLDYRTVLISFGVSVSHFVNMF